MLKKVLSILLCVMIAVSVTSCAATKDIKTELELTADTKTATIYTQQINSAVYSQLDFTDTSEYDNATRGLIDAPDSLEIKDEDGNVVWSQDAYSFLDEYEEAPDTVNPSLWENTKNNHVYGLFEVVDGIYQVRGYDISNLTVIEGETGYIVYDTMMSIECTQASLELIYKNLGEKPIKAVVISHSHADHFGGLKGILSEDERADSSLSIEEQLESGKIPIIVPEGFEEYAVSENLYSGMAMNRRANYQYGAFLEENVTGTLGMGIGMAQSAGLSTYLSPTYEICESGETITIDGITLEFQLTPGSEAPAEMNTWLPQYNALWLAENCTSTLHNLYTLRGAEVRDGDMWAQYITQAISLYGDEAQVVFQSHNWPHWGKDTINDYMVNTAAVYKFIHDQTLTYINQGYTSEEIANMIELPEELNKVWYTRQYYGTVAHNAKAVYQKYIGWYDANPVNLNALPKSESAQKWVEYLGDTDEVLRMAKEDYDNGEYQWVAEITNVLVYADPENEAARLLCADALEQLGYQSESGTWRNVYLSAAKELREGNQAENSSEIGHSGDGQKAMASTSMLGYMGILLNKENLEGENFKINITLTDTKETHSVQIRDGVMLTYENSLFEQADASITCQKAALFAIISGDVDTVKKAMQIDGDAELIYLLTENMNAYNGQESGKFNIIEP